MKSIKTFLLAVFAGCVLNSCDENEFLKEKPLSIYTAENSLVTAADFQAAVNYLYYGVRYQLFEGSQNSRYALMYATDLAHAAYDTKLLNTYKANMIPTAGEVLNIWRFSYSYINQANLILTRIKDTNIDEATKNKLCGQALCIRAFGYKILANLYGGVPLLLEEITGIRRDAVRATREEVYIQCKNDLQEAISLLDNIDNVRDGEVSKQVAQHFLAEVYICLGNNDEAIKTATDVIEYPAMALMTKRFGSASDKEGSPFSDLFKINNQNRGSGNTESLWVTQYDYLNPASSTYFLDRLAFTFIPQYYTITITVDGVTTTAFSRTMEKGGAGAGWMQPTKHVTDEIWEEGDLRNAPYLIVRDFKIDNPASPAYGKWFVADGYCTQAHRFRNWYPFFMKTVSGSVPEELWQKDRNGNPVLTGLGEHVVTSAAQHRYRDSYICRLAETYLLRAEAYLNKGDKEKAADDINTVRSRSNAPLVEPADVDIDYLLDERLRELTFEELRMCTLCRMGKLVERTKKYNSTYIGRDGKEGESSGLSMQEYHNLWPIPYSEIERNTEAVLEQNPGYIN